MYKALIVDDEPGILKGLIDIVQWEDYGIEIIGQANNGADALSIIEAWNINILITDIKMPVMNGLELIKQARVLNRYLKIIILSGYDDFALVKEAAMHGIENYLLKPIIRDELSLTLLNISEKIENEVTQQIQLRSGALILRNNIINRWLTNSISSANLVERADILQIDISSRQYLVCLVKVVFQENDDPSFKNMINYGSENICNELLSPLCKTITVTDSNGYLVLIIHTNQPHFDYKKLQDLLKKCQNYINKFFKREVFIAMGSAEKENQLVHQSYANALHLMEYNLILPPNTIVDYAQMNQIDKRDPDKINANYEIFKQHISSKNKDGATGFIVDIYEQIAKKTGISPITVQNISTEMLFHILGVLNANKIDPATLFEIQDNLFVQLLKMKNLEELSTWLQIIVLKSIDKLKYEEASKNPLIQRVLDHLEIHYADNISLKTLSSAFNVNAAYLGQMFIKEKGNTFSSYLNGKRIESAKDLLQNTKLDLKEIAEKVGYVNQSYFNNIFKKITGIYPTKYRLNNLKTD
ncbi:response regulator transcription factor [Paenibacillus eucommiae]|uniref:Two-component system response regulator YesN n=1 Tax=Paenibacillus eucommiae TaxID=1355755 RepID=A0ABS4ITN6_9BACL|nr:response regulator [Paenibacillus eucommiae]MBP1990937.1 two-component system response regulator YesN [Paenibacillus eucommiae]